MHRPHVDDLDPCPNCGDPVWRTHRCKAPAKPMVGMPDDFRERVSREIAQAHDVPEQLLDTAAYDRALFEDVGL